MCRARRHEDEMPISLSLISLMTLLLVLSVSTGESIRHSHENSSAGNASPSLQLESVRSLRSSTIPKRIVDAIEQLRTNAKQMKEKCQDREHEFIGNSAYSRLYNTVPLENHRNVFQSFDGGRKFHCQPPKVGSTGILSALLEAEGFSLKNIRHSVDIHKYANEQLRTLDKVYRGSRLVTYERIQGDFENATWSMITRNPWTRVLSGFKDKFRQFPNNQKYDRTWGPTAAKILGIYDPKAKTSPNLRMNVTFEQFTRYLSEHTGLRAQRLNAHWVPYSLLCQPCLFPYEYVARIEHADEVDALTYLLTGKLPEEVVEKDGAASVRANKSGSSTKDVMNQYYTPQIRTWVEQVFGDDAWLMDYSFEG